MKEELIKCADVFRTLSGLERAEFAAVMDLTIADVYKTGTQSDKRELEEIFGCSPDCLNEPFYCFVMSN